MMDSDQIGPNGRKSITAPVDSPNKALTHRQELFARLVATGTHKAEAYRLTHKIRPDGSTANHRVSGHKISTLPHVAKRIDELKRTLTKIDDATLQQYRNKVYVTLADLIDNATKEDATRVRAIDVMAKVLHMQHQAPAPPKSRDAADIVADLRAIVDRVADAAKAQQTPPTPEGTGHPPSQRSESHPRAISIPLLSSPTPTQTRANDCADE